MATKSDTLQSARSAKDGSSALRHAKKTRPPSATTAIEREAHREGEALLRDAVTGSRLGSPDAFNDLKQAAQTRYGRDLASVNLSTSAHSAQLSEALGARGVTFGSNIHISTRMHAGYGDIMTTAAHEMVHAVQQTGGAHHSASVGSAPTQPVLLGEKAMGEQWFAVKLNRLNYLLSYGLFDWAITDSEASEALELLESMNSTERATALGSIRVDRLRDNLPNESQIERLDIMLKQTESMRTSVQDINDLLDTHLFDWMVTDAEANEAIRRLQALPLPDRHYAVMGINQRVLMKNLDAERQMQFEQMRSAAQDWWNRQRQQRDPLNPGDEIRIRVYNAVGGSFENDYFMPERIYQVSGDETITVPMLGHVDVSGQRPEDIAARISQRLVSEQYLWKAAVSVEVVRRGAEVFEAQEFAFVDKQPEDALLPGDTFTMMVVESNRLEEETDFSISYRIDAGGTVELPYIGRIQAAGLTRSELVASLQQHFSGWFRREPLIWVWIRSHGDIVYRHPRDSEKPTVVTQHSTREWLSKQKPLLIPKRQPVDIYLEFYRQKNAELQNEKVDAREKRVGQEALFRFMDWLGDNSGDPDTLSANDPWSVYGRFYNPLLIADIKRQSRETVERERREKEEAQHSAMVKARLDEYWEWAMGRWREAGVQFRSAGRAYLITEHPYRKIGMNALTDAVLSWAYSNTSHPDFARLTPNEVALILMEEDPHLATIVEIGRNARPTLEYFPEMDRTRRTLGDDALEIFIGLLPVLGEAQDFNDLATGVSITGEELGTGDRLLAGLGLLIPFVPGKVFRSGDDIADVVSDLARKTGRSIDEIEDVFRVAGNLTQSDARHIERIMGVVADNKKLSKADLDILDDIARKLKGPLEELAEARKVGGQLPVKPLRVDPITATRLVPGNPEHMAQRWLEYQVRHGEKYSRLTSHIDPKWAKLYDTILANKKAGGKFESDVIDWMATNHIPGVTKNNQMMISAAEDARGFIPDGVKGNPAELIWGQPYHFVEVKGWKEMSNTGNLKSMIEYVDEFGGHIEVVFRSASHPDGITKLSGPLEKVLGALIAQGKATVRRYP